MNSSYPTKRTPPKKETKTKTKTGLKTCQQLENKLILILASMFGNSLGNEGITFRTLKL